MALSVQPSGAILPTGKPTDVIEYMRFTDGLDAPVVHKQAQLMEDMVNNIPEDAPKEQRERIVLTRHIIHRRLEYLLQAS